MIIRALRLRHGRLALPKNPGPSITTRVWRRCASTQDHPAYTNAEWNKEQKLAQITPDGGPAAKLRALEGRDVEDPVAQAYIVQQMEKQRYSAVGTVLAPYYKPHELLTNPPRPEDITLELLLASGAHLGHATQLWHPGNAQYIYGVRGSASGDPIHIISLDVTAAHLRRACKVVQGVAEAGGVILFVGTRSGQARAVVKAASMAKGYHLFSKWIPGTITNGQQILGNCDKIAVNEKDEVQSAYDEQLPDLSAIKPDLVVCLNPMENYVLLRECGQNGIPTIGIVDTDCNPTWVTYPVPANDDSPRAVQVIAGALGRAGEEGQRVRLEYAEEGIVNYQTSHMLVSPAHASKSSAKRYDRRAQSSVQDLDTDDISTVSAVEQEENDRQLLELLHSLESGSHTARARRNANKKAAEERADDTLDTSLLSDELAAAEAEVPEILEEDFLQLQHSDEAEMAGSVAESNASSYKDLSRDELDGLMRIYSGAEDVKSQNIGAKQDAANDVSRPTATDPVATAETDALPSDESILSDTLVTQSTVSAENNATGLSSDSSPTKHQDAVSPIAQEYPVENVQIATESEIAPKEATPAPEQKDDQVQSTRDQVDDVAEELGEAPRKEEKGEVPTVQQGDAVPEEPPARKQSGRKSAGKKQK